MLTDTGNKQADTGNKPTDTGNKPTDTGNKPTDTGNKQTDTGNKPTGTRKRRASAGSMGDPEPPSKGQRAPTGDGELRGIMQGLGVYTSIYRRLEYRWSQLKREARANADEAAKSAARGAEIAKLCDQIHGLRTKLSEEGKKVTDLLAEKTDLEALAMTQNQLIDIGMNAINSQSTKAVDLHKENDSLCSKTVEQQACIERLTETINQMACAEGDKYFTLGREAQAEQTLALVHKMQADLAEKSATIQGYEERQRKMKADLAEQHATIQGFEERQRQKEAKAPDYRPKVSGQGERVARAKQQQREQAQVIECLQNALNMTKKRETAAKEIAERQQQEHALVIERLQNALDLAKQKETVANEIAEEQKKLIKCLKDLAWYPTNV